MTSRIRLAWGPPGARGACQVRGSAREVLPKARAAAAKPLELDGSLAEAHTALGYKLWYDWDWPGAEKEFKRVLELNPSDSEADRL